MKISICTQIKNRLHQFEETFKKNIDEINKHENIEWVIVDVNSNDGLKNFIEKNIQTKINYFECLEFVGYSIPIAKNFAARLSSGDYVFNLDADNFLGSIVDKIIEKNYIGINCEVTGLGVFGRIGCDKSIFKKVGGYDESFLPAGHHEQDFFSRCRLVNYKFNHINYDELPIQNTKNDTIANTGFNLSWNKMNETNKLKKNNNIKNKIINPNLIHKKCKFMHNFKSMIELKEEF